MRLPLSENFINLCKNSPAPVYAVGGAVRDFLISGEVSADIDVCGDLLPEAFISLAEKFGFHAVAIYKRTGTAVVTDGKRKYEYSVTREEVYPAGGAHTPQSVTFSVGAERDALRRDFKCNAVYYDIAGDKYIDPLGGIKDVKARVISAAALPEEVFSHDGLRLMRLARFTGELGFTVERETLSAAKKFAGNVKDVSAERVKAELDKILHADAAHSFSPEEGHYRALKVLDETRVLDEILPELTLGRGMAQRSDFHKYDVLEHSLRCACYADEKVRLAALLHDVGKPERFIATGKYYGHADTGELIAKDVLMRLKYDKKTVKETCFLVKNHMLDIDGSMKESDIKLFIAKNFDEIEKLLLIFQTDHRASMEENDVAPSVIRWRKIIDDMRKNGTPKSVKDLKITAEQLKNIGFSDRMLGREREKLFDRCVLNSRLNDEKTLLRIATKDFAAFIRVDESVKK